MNLTILAVGTKMPHWVTAAVDEYSKRFKGAFKIKLQEIKPEKRSQGINAAQGVSAEESRLNAAIPSGSFLVVLDERGKALTSKELAQYLATWRQSAHHVCFIIGGADGLSTTIKSRANLVLQLSNLTLPHGMVRVLLLEQLYRAISILNQHPYHRE